MNNKLSRHTETINCQTEKIQALIRATADQIDEYRSILHLVCENIVDDRLVDATILLNVITDCVNEIEGAVGQIEELNRRELKKAVTDATA